MGQQDDNLPRLYAASEVAAVLGCSEWWVKEQARRRRIPFIRSGSGYRFSKVHVDEILALLEERPEQRPSLGTETAPARLRTPSKSTAPVTQLRARRPRRSRDAA